MIADVLAVAALQLSIGIFCMGSGAFLFWLGDKAVRRGQQ